MSKLLITLAFNENSSTFFGEVKIAIYGEKQDFRVLKFFGCTKFICPDQRIGAAVIRGVFTGRNAGLKFLSQY